MSTKHWGGVNNGEQTLPSLAKRETPLSCQLSAIVPDREMPATPLHRRRAPADAAKVGDFPRSPDVIASCIDDQHCSLGRYVQHLHRPFDVGGRKCVDPDDKVKAAAVELDLAKLLKRGRVPH